MAPIISPFLRLLTAFWCPSAQGGAVVGMTLGPGVPTIQMPRLNAAGGFWIWKMLPCPLVGSMNALLLLIHMGQRLQKFNLLSRQKVSDCEWEFAFPDGVGGNIRIDQHFLVGDSDLFGIYSECCLYSFLLPGTPAALSKETLFV